MIEGEPRPLAARRGRSLAYRGKTLLSVVDPIAQADRLALAAPKLERTLYFCPSPLYGYGLRALLSAIPANSAVLCVECDERLARLASDEIEADLLDSSRFAFVHTDDPIGICVFVRDRWGPRAFRRIENVRLSGGWALAEAAYGSMVDALRADIAINWSNAMTLVRLGRRYALNAARNLALLSTAERLDRLDFGGSPILVFGAGPSMDAVADRLARSGFAESKARPFRILCADTALAALLARGIRPDLIVALEAQHWNLRDFVGTAKAAIPLAMDLSAHPGTAGASGGRLALFATRWASLSFLRRLDSAGLAPPPLPPLGSVGLTAVAAALRTTTGPVVVAGLDFAYNLDAYHARSTPSREDRLRTSSRLRSVIDPAPAFRPRVAPAAAKDGTPVRSDPALRGYRDQFRREFASRGRVFDAGVIGLDLGVPRVDPEEAIGLLAAGAGPLEGYAAREGERREDGSAGRRTASVSSVRDFVDAELDRLERLKDALSGKKEARGSELASLVDECDYLWAHFPECAGADGARPSVDDLSFMKRVRAEIDPFAKAFGLAAKDLEP